MAKNNSMDNWGKGRYRGHGRIGFRRSKPSTNTDTYMLLDRRTKEELFEGTADECCMWLDVTRQTFRQEYRKNRIKHVQVVRID